MDEKIKEYIVSLVYSTRTPKKYGLDLEAYIKTGASPRATINLAKASKAIAYMNGRGYVTPQDVKSVAMDVLRHRVAMTYEAEAEEITSEMVVQKVLDMIPVP
jgi:MoxR-like ATPase